MSTQIVASLAPMADTAWILKMELTPTTRELECLRGVATGQTTSAIGASLNISPRTVDHHIASLMRKLGAPTRAAAVALAVLKGYLALEGLEELTDQSEP